MTKPIVQETNATTGETTEREMTAAEIATRKAVLDEMTQLIADNEAKVAQKAALLTKLGITEDEAKLLA
jgi:hypothetical protein